jgi:prephenate dehydratase
MEKKIAIQGYPGAFHQVAAQQVFGAHTPIIPCATFRGVVQKAEHDPECGGAVMALENSIAGSILPNYALLQKTELEITGEVYLPIRQNLLVLPGTSLTDIEEVHSHPMALLQCGDYLHQKGWRLVESVDTALSARDLSEGQHKNRAAIAGALAAELYGLQVLDENIQEEKNNFTRFVVLQKRESRWGSRQEDKASVYFLLPHTGGSLANILTLFAGCGINLSKLQSVSLPQKPWEYAFHADLEFSQIEQFTAAVNGLKQHASFYKVLGLYKRGERATPARGTGQRRASSVKP